MRRLNAHRVGAANPQLSDESKPDVKQAEIARNKESFVREYPACGTIGETLSLIGIKSRTTFYNWLKEDAEFKAKYEKELQPNRRDAVATIIYKIAMGKMPNATSQQLTAAFGFLKATEGGKDKQVDDLTFTERVKSDVNNSGETILIIKEDGNGSGK